MTYEADVAGRLTRPVVEYTGGDGSSRRVRLDGRSFSLSVAMPSGARGTYRLALRGRAAEAQLRVQVTVRQDGQVLAVRRGAGVFTSGMAEVSAAVEVPIEGE